MFNNDRITSLEDRVKKLEDAAFVSGEKLSEARLTVYGMYPAQYRQHSVADVVSKLLDHLKLSIKHHPATNNSITLTKGK